MAVLPASLLPPCRDLKRHMLAAEERCLESLAWQPGSSLYPTLVAAVGAQGGAAGSGSDVSVPAPAQAGAASAAGAEQQQQQQGLQQQATRSQGAADSSGPQAGSEVQLMQALEVGEAPNGGAAGDTASMDEEGATSATLPAQQQQHVQQQQQQPEAPAAQGGLPLCLGQEPPAAWASAAPSAGSEPQREASTAAAPPPGDRAARAAAADFLRRVLKLGAFRLADLLSRLDTEPADPQQLLAEVRWRWRRGGFVRCTAVLLLPVIFGCSRLALLDLHALASAQCALPLPSHTQAYTLARHVAFEQTWLLYGRHLDQALLCCAYAVCKAS